MQNNKQFAKLQFCLRRDAIGRCTVSFACFVYTDDASIPPLQHSRYGTCQLLAKKLCVSPTQRINITTNGDYFHNKTDRSVFVTEDQYVYCEVGTEVALFVVVVRVNIVLHAVVP
jgi:hypothetical protein